MPSSWILPILQKCFGKRSGRGDAFDDELDRAQMRPCLLHISNLAPHQSCKPSATLTRAGSAVANLKKGGGKTNSACRRNPFFLDCPQGVAPGTPLLIEGRLSGSPASQFSASPKECSSPRNDGASAGPPKPLAS